MNVLDTSKSALGKLLATENIRIEHQQVRGPSFDVKNRVLVLPIWKDVDSDLYDLMIGHEVGHALYTPADGWMDKVKEYGDEYKTMLNLVEDARIEKKMKRKFPGLTRPMYNGYTNLVDRGFFGCPIEDMKSMSFIDRLNVYFKLGARSNVSFTDTEQNLVNRIAQVETWDEVMSLAKELLGVAKKDAEDLEKAFEDIMNQLENPDGSNNGSNDSDTNEGSSSSIEDMISKLRKAGRDDLADRLEKASENFKNQLEQQLANGEMMESMTQNSLEQNSEKLIDEKAYPLTYVTMPDLDVNKFVVPANVVHDAMNFAPEMLAKRDLVYNTFMSSTKRYISYLVKEFELRRNAAQFAKAKVSKTGKLDVDKMWKYQLSEDLFLQSTVVPNGKNHGMLMMIDMSSSMDNNISGTIEQMVSLVLFCRKVNIPFDVYGFYDTNLSAGEIQHFSNLMTTTTHKNMWGEVVSSINMSSRNSTKAGDLNIQTSSFRLRQLIHTGMRIGEFNNAIKNLLLLAEGFRRSRGYSYYTSYYTVPTSMSLGGTPLNESILVLRKVAENFKQQYKVEVLNTIILTDGDASYGLGYNSAENKEEGLPRNFVIEDRKTRHQVFNKNRFSITNALLEMYKHLTKSRVIGIYLMSGKTFKNDIYRRASQADNFDSVVFEKQYKDEFHNHKYFGLTQAGYDIYYMVPGNELEIEEIDMSKTMKEAKTLLTAFKKMQNNKQISRVFLNQFIKQVA